MILSWSFTASPPKPSTDRRKRRGQTETTLSPTAFPLALAQRDSRQSNSISLKPRSQQSAVESAFAAFRGYGRGPAAAQCCVLSARPKRYAEIRPCARTADPFRQDIAGSDKSIRSAMTATSSLSLKHRLTVIVHLPLSAGLADRAILPWKGGVSGQSP